MHPCHRSASSKALLPPALPTNPLPIAGLSGAAALSTLSAILHPRRLLLWCLAFLPLYLLTLTLASAAPPAGYYLVWGDEFNGTALDTNKWDYWVDNRTWGDAYNDGAVAVSVSGGHLVITTQTLSGTTYTAMVASDNHFRPRYGYYEASVKWGDYSGQWSAFWLRSPILGTYLNDPLDDGGELDVCEHRYVGIYGTNIANVVSDNIHWNGYGSAEQSTGSPNVGSGLATNFHTYSLLWTNDWYDLGIDGSTVWHTGYNGSPPTPQFGSSVYVIFSSQVQCDSATCWAGPIPSGGYPTGTNQMLVDYFRYYAPTNVLFWTAANSAYWTNSANWVSNMPPLPSSDLTFSYLSRNLNSVMGANYSVDGLVFLPMSNSASIGGTNTLTLGAGGIDMIAANNNVTLTAPVALSSAQRWTVGRNSPGNLLALNASLSGTAALTKAGYGTLVLAGTNSFSGTLNVDTDGSTNDGRLLVADSEAIAHVASPIALRNTGIGVSTLQLSNGVNVAQRLTLAGRSTNSVGLEAMSGQSTLAAGLTLTGGGPSYLVQCDSGTLTLAGTIAATGTATGARCLTLQGNGNFAVTGTVQNGSASPLSLLKTNNGSLTLWGANTFTGTATNAGGTLFLNGSLASPLFFSSGTLTGTGTVAGDTTVWGGEVSPGALAVNAIGTLSFGGSLTLQNAAFTYMELDAARQTNDQLIVAGALSYGGTLYVANLEGTLMPGQAFQLFKAATYAPGFASLTLPTLDANSAWDLTRLASDGSISVAALPSVTVSPPNSQAAAGSTVTLTAQAAGTPPLTCQWFDINTNAIPGATNTTLTLPSITPAQAGNYTVQIANDVGDALAVATVTVLSASPPPSGVAVSYAGGQLQLNWTNGTLQGASNPGGPYTDLSNATAPFAVYPTNSQQFFRLRE